MSSASPTMASRLTLVGIKTNSAPLVTVTTTALYHSPVSNVKSLVQVKGANCRNLGLQALSPNPVLIDNKRIGQSGSYRLMTSPMYIETLIMKSGGGHKPTSRVIYMQVGGKEAGEVRVRVGSTVLTVVQGPVGILTEGEAGEIFGRSFKPQKVFNPQKDCAVLGVGLYGDDMSVPMVTRRVLTEDGIVRETAVRRRRRNVEL